MLVMSLMIPGYAFRARVRWLGTALLAVYVLLLLLFLVELGTSLANVAFGLMIALHATSICYALEQMTGSLTLLKRFGLALAILIIMGTLIYRPLLGQMQAHLFMPIRLNDRVYIVKPLTNPDTVQPGTLVVYNMPRWSRGHYLMRAGLGIGKVLAEEKEHVEFTSEGVLVNNTLLPRKAFMPLQGALDVPEKHWFIWPELDINRQPKVPDHILGDMYSSQALVSKDQFVGTICKRWFWRRMD